MSYIALKLNMFTLEDTILNLRRAFYRFLGKTPAKMPMVNYWKVSDKANAKVLEKDGAIVMQIEGEKEVFPGFPRSYLLFGKLSKLKHEIKNQIFNDSWELLEKGESEEVVAEKIRQILPNLYAIADEMKYDMVPPSRMVKAVKEIHRAWTKVSPETARFRDMLTFILQEDDAYRFRAQWIVNFFNPTKWYFRLLGKDIISQFNRALWFLEQAEVIGDMKERIRLLRRILLVLVNNERIKPLFISLVKEIDWDKVKLSKADKYHFRGKYFKVDFDKFEY